MKKNWFDIGSSGELLSTWAEAEEWRKALPTGSGIDCEWKRSKDQQGNHVFSNSFHVMDDAGYYTRWIPFHVHLKRQPYTLLHKLHGKMTNKVQIVHCAGDLFIELHGFRKRDYIDDMIYDNIIGPVGWYWLMKVFEHPLTGTTLDMSIVDDLAELHPYLKSEDTGTFVKGMIEPLKDKATKTLNLYHLSLACDRLLESL